MKDILYSYVKRPAQASLSLDKQNQVGFICSSSL